MSVIGSAQLNHVLCCLFVIMNERQEHKKDKHKEKGVDKIGRAHV